MEKPSKLGLERRKVSLLKLFYMHHSPLAKTQFACRPYTSRSVRMSLETVNVHHTYVLAKSNRLQNV